MAAVATSASRNVNRQNILGVLAGMARRAADRSRMVGLQRRYLDDAGLTPADLDAALSGALGFASAQSMGSLAHSV